MSRLRKIILKARSQVFSEKVGNNPSVFHGEGYDFIELREYIAGDDIKKIDWNITAKLQKPYVKVFREEREINVVLASMLNGSVYFGSKKLKQELIAEIVAIVSFSALRNGDLFSSYIFADKFYSFTRPAKKLFAVHKSVDDILKFDPLGKDSNFKELTSTVMKHVKRKSLLVIVGDFFEIPELKILAKKHELLCIIVRDKMEENPPSFGFASLMDVQTNSTLEGDFNAQTVKAYAKKVHDHDHELYSYLRKEQIRFIKTYTDEDPYIKLRRLFGGRA